MATTAKPRATFAFTPSGASPVGTKLTSRGDCGKVTSHVESASERSPSTSRYSRPSSVNASMPSGSEPLFVSVLRSSPRKPQSAVARSNAVPIELTTVPSGVWIEKSRVPPTAPFSPSLASAISLSSAIHWTVSGWRSRVISVVNSSEIGLVSAVSARKVEEPTSWICPAVSVGLTVGSSRSKTAIAFASWIEPTAVLSSRTSTYSGCACSPSAVRNAAGSSIRSNAQFAGSGSLVSTRMKPGTPPGVGLSAVTGWPSSRSFSTAITARVPSGLTATESGTSSSASVPGTPVGAPAMPSGLASSKRTVRTGCRSLALRITMPSTGSLARSPGSARPLPLMSLLSFVALNGAITHSSRTSATDVGPGSALTYGTLNDGGPSGVSSSSSTLVPSPRSTSGASSRSAKIADRTGLPRLVRSYLTTPLPWVATRKLPSDEMSTISFGLSPKR